MSQYDALAAEILTDWRAAKLDRSDAAPDSLEADQLRREIDALREKYERLSDQALTFGGVALPPFPHE